jgi:predicted enzyme related to lactoylglutathione lyase
MSWMCLLLALLNTTDVPAAKKFYSALFDSASATR